MTLRRAALVSLACAVAALYLHARANAGAIGVMPTRPAVSAASETPSALRRAPEQTYLTYPEWFLVYSPREYAELLALRPPSTFPYLGHIEQLWQGYRGIFLASAAYPFNSEYHVMIWVIALSTTVEYSIKGGYELLFGRVAELLQSQPSAEDRLMARVARDYVAFLDVEPWYKFDFLTPLSELWTRTGVPGVDLFRKVERKYFLTTEYLIKAAYGWVIGKSSQSAYGAPEPTTAVVLDRLPSPMPAGLDDLTVIETHPDGSVLAKVPRYQAFTRYATMLTNAGVTFREIAGNVEPILITAVVPARFDLSGLTVLLEQRILTRSGQKRILFTTNVRSLGEVIRRFSVPGAVLEHIYDY